MAFVLLQTVTGWIAAGGPLDVAHGLILASVVLPVMVLVHEAGHATVGLLRTEGLVLLRVGRAPGWLRGRVGRLAFEVSPLPSRTKQAGWARTFARMTRGELVAYAVAGAAAQLVVLVLAVPLIGQTSGAVHGALVWAWAAYFLQICLNLVPRRVGGHMTDGAHLFAAIRAQPVEPSHRSPRESTVEGFISEFTDTMSRWLVLVTDDSGSYWTQRRGATLAGAAWALGLKRELSPEVRTACWHALAGWCWREAERGDAERVRDTVEEVWRRTAQQGLVGRELDAAVAAALAVDADLGLGSPGSTNDERRGFLVRGFNEIKPPADARALGDKHRLFCFRYGIALHDVEVSAGGTP
jgi:hypothetical protein